MKLSLPYNLKLRSYQLEVAKALFEKKYNRFINVWHRRAGKDLFWLNLTFACALKERGLYLYCLKTNTQTRTVIWDGMNDVTGFKYLNHLPSKFIVEKNKHEMKLELVNGSKIQFLGADNFETKALGSGAKGIVLSEYSTMLPQLDIIRPILKISKGWAAFLFTPRGQNHAKDLYDMNIDNPKWFVNKLTVQQTFDVSGNRIITDKDIEEDRRSGMSEQLIQQEYYCDFNIAQEGSIFGSQMQQVLIDNRIKDFEIDTDYPVYTFWDLGYSDKTSIWFAQIIGEKIFLIDYVENNNKPIKFYIDLLDQKKYRNNWTYALHYAPHDVQNNSLIGNVRDFAAKHNLFFERVPRVNKKSYSIEAARNILSKCIFNKEKCKIGIECLRGYHYKWDDVKHINSMKPEHDCFSHGADAFQQLALIYKDIVRDLEAEKNSIYHSARKIGQVGYY